MVALPVVQSVFRMGSAAGGVWRVLMQVFGGYHGAGIVGDVDPVAGGKVRDGNLANVVHIGSVVDADDMLGERFHQIQVM